MIPKFHPRILIIDDDEAIRRTLEDMLTLNGFEAVTATNGTEGRILARSAKPALIITDLSMPGMTGFELLKSFGSDPELRTVPVIVISAAVDRSSIRRGMELGAADFITKPFTETEVIHSIRTRLEKKDLIEELDAFAHTVAHDLKTPLCTLNGRLEILQMMIGKADEATLRRHLEEASSSSRQLDEIIESLLLLAGVRRQRVPMKQLDMNSIVNETLNRQDGILKRRNAQVIRPDSWPEAAGHAPWVGEIWANYISNAAKYGGPNPVITLGGERISGSNRSRFWVQDKGPGLTEVALNQLFVPFSQISTANRVSGHGLGLSIVHRIAEKLGGHVGADCRTGQGTLFWFELPAEPKPHTNHPFVVA